MTHQHEMTVFDGSIIHDAVIEYTIGEADLSAGIGSGVGDWYFVEIDGNGDKAHCQMFQDWIDADQQESDRISERLSELCWDHEDDESDYRYESRY